MTIDSHQHFWKYSPVRDSWIDETMRVIRKDFYPQDLKPILDTNGIDGCIAVQADQSEEETEFLLTLAKENSFIKGVVGWVDLCDANVEERLAYYAQNIVFKGVRYVLQGEEDEFMLRKDFLHGISKLRQYNLTYDILVFENQLESVLKLVAQFPRQTFVIDHIAKPKIKEREIEVWSEQMTALAKFPNVYCKISGMITEANWKKWNYLDIKPYLEVVFSAFGIKRVLYGSDWPVCLLAGSYEAQRNVLETFISKFSIEDKALVMGGNAVEFYNLKE
ncbi:MAG: amidohydrolase family protein [Cellulophaga sp.]